MTQRMLFECEALMMPFLQGYGRFDRCQWISFASTIYLFVQMGGRATTRVRLKIRGAAAKLFVLWRRAAQSHNIPGAEPGELVVATLPRGRVGAQLRRVLKILSSLPARGPACRAGRALG